MILRSRRARQGHVICQWSVKGGGSRKKSELTLGVQTLETGKSLHHCLEAGPSVGEGDELFWTFVV